MLRIERRLGVPLLGKARKTRLQEQDASILDQYISSAPSIQNALDIFEGEWASKLPGELSSYRAGENLLFEDARLEWATAELNGVDGHNVLELGPLEAGHSYMLERRGAARIIAIEANIRAYLKCLIIKEIVGLERTHFLCGDFIEYLRDSPPRFDVCMASGVLYHMQNPVQLIDLISRVSGRLFIWTHYYDAMTISKNSALAQKFRAGFASRYGDFTHTLYPYYYEKALGSMGFCGGSHIYSHWMTRDDILACLRHFGMVDIRIGFEDPDHPNGPSLSLVASKS